MSDLFHLTRGFTKGTADYVEQQRKIARENEDKELEFVKSTLTNMSSRPDFDSSAYASLLDYMHTLSQPRAQKKGMKGFMGQHEALPISQMIATVTHGDPSRPFQGDPTKTPISDQALGMLSGKGPQPGPSDPTKSAPTSSQAPSPEGGSAPTSLAPEPTTPSAAAGVPNAPMPAPPAPLPPAAASAQPPLNPVPPSQIPQTPGTSGMAQAANAVAVDSTAMAQGAQLPSPPPQMPPGASDAEFAAAQNGRGQGMQSWFKSDDETRIAGDRKTFSGATAKSAGEIEGKRVELRRMLGREPTVAELKNYASTAVERSQAVTGFVTDPNTGEQHIMTAIWNPMAKTFTHPDTGAPIEGFTRTGTGAAQPNQRMVVQPDGSVKMVTTPKIGGAPTTADVPGVTGRKQFAPVSTIKSSDPNTGRDVTTLVPRDVVGGSVPAAGGVGAGAPGAKGAKGGGKLTPPPAAGNGVEITHGAGGTKSISSNPVAKFDAQQKNAIAGIDSAGRFAKDALKFIEDNNLINDNNPLDSRWNAILYKLGIDPGQTESLIQNVGIIEPKAIIGQMGGQRGQFWGQMLQQHTAQPSNTYALMYKKLKGMVRIGEGIKQDLNTAALMRPTTSGPRNPATGEGTGSSAGLPAPPNTGGGGAGAGGATVKLVSPKTGQTYNIPRELVEAFKKDHPGAVEAR